MFKILKRYIGGFLLTSTIWLTTFFISVYYFDGVIPTIIFSFTVIWIILYIPFNMRQDFNKIRDHVVKIKMVKKGEMTKTEFGIDSLRLISEETGFPEFLVEMAVNKFNKKGVLK